MFQAVRQRQDSFHGKESVGGFESGDAAKDAGRNTEPRVCSPAVDGTIPAAIAAAEPLELPPGECPGSRVPRRRRCLIKQLQKKSVEWSGLAQRLELPMEAEPVLAEEALQAGDELAARDAAENLHR